MGIFCIVFFCALRLHGPCMLRPGSVPGIAMLSTQYGKPMSPGAASARIPGIKRPCHRRKLQDGLLWVPLSTVGRIAAPGQSVVDARGLLMPLFGPSSPSASMEMEEISTTSCHCRNSGIGKDNVFTFPSRGHTIGIQHSAYKVLFAFFFL
jgi:hypothetical protein